MSLNHGDMFWEMCCQVILPSWEHCRVYLHKCKRHSLLYAQAVWYSLLLLSSKHVTGQNSIGNCNRMISICVSKHRKDTAQIWRKRLKVVHECRALAVKGAGRTGRCSGTTSRCSSVSSSSTPIDWVVCHLNHSLVDFCHFLIFGKPFEAMGKQTECLLPNTIHTILALVLLPKAQARFLIQ